MTPGQALGFVRRAVATNRVVFSAHALENSMPDDEVTVDDILCVLENATSATSQNDAKTKWKLYGPLPSAAAYAVVCFFKKNRLAIVVTSHEPP